MAVLETVWKAQQKLKMSVYYMSQLVEKTDKTLNCNQLDENKNECLILSPGHFHINENSKKSLWGHLK